MGGHAAWRKRVAAGELAKGSGGAALRHRPRLGRKGADLALNRLGNLGGYGNPKRKLTKKSAKVIQESTSSIPLPPSNPKVFHGPKNWISSWIIALLVFICAIMVVTYDLVYTKSNKTELHNLFTFSKKQPSLHQNYSLSNIYTHFRQESSSSV